MGIDRDTISQLRHLLRPLATRVANAIARSVVQLVDDSTKLQLLQVGVLADETIDGAEHHQPYGFASVPLAGAEAVVVFPNGDRGHPLVIAASDRRYRPTGGQVGQVTLHHYLGAKLTMLADGKVYVTNGGTALALATKADLDAVVTYLKKQFDPVNGHVHATPAGPTTGITEASTTTNGTCPAPTGTTVLRGQ